jgi:hypothetical protein
VRRFSPGLGDEELEQLRSQLEASEGD